MTYTVKNHPGGYDIYKDGKPLDANEVVRLLEQRDQFEMSGENTAIIGVKCGRSKPAVRLMPPKAGNA